MDHLWSPWRYRNVSSGAPTDAWLFCVKAASSEDRANYVVLRAEHNYILLNLYPYTSGHVMIAPYAHIATLEEAKPEALAEMMDLAPPVERAFHAVYKSAGANLGMNVGQSAAAALTAPSHIPLIPHSPTD